jgi:hypothetical protein
MLTLCAVRAGSAGSVPTGSSECATIRHAGQWLYDGGSNTCDDVTGQEPAGSKSTTTQRAFEACLCEFWVWEYFSVFHMLMYAWNTSIITYVSNLTVSDHFRDCLVRM